MSSMGYWNIRGYAQGIRLMLAYVGEDCEERRYNFGPAPDFSGDDWFKEKFTHGLDFPNIPYYKNDKVNISQSHAILRHLSRKYNMQAKTEEETTRIDLAEDEVKDLRSSITGVCYDKSGAGAEEGKKAFLTNTLPVKLNQWEAFLGDRRFLAGDNISYVDFEFYVYLEMIRFLDEDYLRGHEKLKAYIQRFETLPQIKEYLASDKFLKWPIWSPSAKLLC